jgi:hypothetical protein
MTDIATTDTDAFDFETTAADDNVVLDIVAAVCAASITAFTLNGIYHAGKSAKTFVTSKWSGRRLRVQSPVVITDQVIEVNGHRIECDTAKESPAN